MNDRDADTVTQTCECGAETYHIKTTKDRQTAWAECTECGRPTSVFGDGPQMQRRWEAQQHE